MATATYKTKVKDGVLPLPSAARDKLNLREGDDVEVAVSTPGVEASGKENPLLKIIGIGKGGPEDGGVNHDKYLYGSDPK
jgi:bifunctional DNA-binding transcriptional regulator/antitoxin component of YhaV-PrlF toxin-antitoxin module